VTNTKKIVGSREREKLGERGNVTGQTADGPYKNGPRPLLNSPAKRKESGRGRNKRRVRSKERENARSGSVPQNSHGNLGEQSGKRSGGRNLAMGGGTHARLLLSSGMKVSTWGPVEFERCKRQDWDRSLSENACIPLGLGKRGSPCANRSMGKPYGCWVE